MKKVHQAPIPTTAENNGDVATLAKQLFAAKSENERLSNLLAACETTIRVQSMLIRPSAPAVQGPPPMPAPPPAAGGAT